MERGFVSLEDYSLDLQYLHSFGIKARFAEADTKHEKPTVGLELMVFSPKGLQVVFWVSNAGAAGALAAFRKLRSATQQPVLDETAWERILRMHEVKEPLPVV